MFESLRECDNLEIAGLFIAWFVVIFYTVAGISASFLSVFIISTYNIGFVSLFALPLVLLVFIAVGYFAYQSVRGIREQKSRQLDPLVAYCTVAGVLSFVIAIFLPTIGSICAVVHGLLNFTSFFVLAGLQKRFLTTNDEHIDRIRPIRLRAPASYKV